MNTNATPPRQRVSRKPAKPILLAIPDAHLHGRAPDPALARDRLILQMTSELHATPAEGGNRKRVMIRWLCRLVDARRGRISILGMDAATGLPRAVSTVSVGATGDLPAAASFDDGPCLDVYLPLAGIRLVACLTLARNVSDSRFTAAERALVTSAHADCTWVYDADRLAAETARAES